MLTTTFFFFLFFQGGAGFCAGWLDATEISKSISESVPVFKVSLFSMVGVSASSRLGFGLKVPIFQGFQFRGGLLGSAGPL